MAAQVDAVVGPWLDQDSHGLDDALLAQLAVELGGNPSAPEAAPAHMQKQHINTGSGPDQLQRQYSFAGGQQASLSLNQSGDWGPAHLNSTLSSLVQHSSQPQPMLLPFTMMSDQQLHNTTAGTAFGSTPAPHQGQPTSLASVLSLSLGPSSLPQVTPQLQPVLMFRPAFGPPAGAAGGAGVGGEALPAGSKSQSPTTSSGCQAVTEDCFDLSDAHRMNKSINKGALAQKRFRERQKEKMRASEAQVAALSSRLSQLEVEKAKLESRARLLEQVVSLNLIHEAKLHTNREIMVREQEMLLEDLAAFVLQLSAARHGLRHNSGSTTNSGSDNNGSSPNSPDWLQMAGQQQQQQQQQGGGLQQQQQQQHGHLLQQHEVLHLLQQQQQWQQQQQRAGVPGGSSAGGSGGVSSLVMMMRGWTVQTMVDRVFPQYIACLQQLLPHISSSPRSGGSSNNAAAAAGAQQQVEALVLKWRELSDRRALFSHYYWAAWCFNRGEMAHQQLAPPTAADWARVLQGLQLSKQQTDAIVAARSNLLSELTRVAEDWQRVLPTLALQLLQVPRAQWHTVGAVQAMVTNLAAERSTVVGFLHTLMDEVLTPVQEGQLEASSYPWCPDVWAIAGAAAAAATAAATNTSVHQDGSSNSRRTKGGRKGSAAAAAAATEQHAAAAQVLAEEDPMAALAVGTDVLTPLMPFMTAFQLLREPVTARGAGLRLKRALLLDPFRTVVPAAAYPAPSAAEVSGMTLLDAHCGTFQKVMLWDWLKANLPSYVNILGGPTSITPTAPAAPAPAPISAPAPMSAPAPVSAPAAQHAPPPAAAAAAAAMPCTAAFVLPVAPGGVLQQQVPPTAHALMPGCQLTHTVALGSMAPGAFMQ